MTTTYSAIISSDYLKTWLRDFDKATKEKKYQRIEPKIWDRLNNLATVNEIKIEAEINPPNAINKFTFYYPIIASKPYIALIPKENQFAQFLSNYAQVENIWILINTSSDTVCLINSASHQDKNNTITIDSNQTPYYWNDISTCPPIDTSNNYKINEMVESLAKLNKAVFDSDGNINLTKKENNNSMDTLNNMFNFDFGPINSDFIRMSSYGFAIRNKDNKYVSYDVKNNCMMDVQILNFNCAGMFYKVPKPLSKITVGDVVFHNGIPMFVREVAEGHTRFTVIDPEEGTEKNILPAHSPFGFDYLTTLISLMDGFDMPASEDNPFGNMLPLILMNNGKTSDQTLIPLMFLANGKMDMSNPLMLLALSGDNLNTNNLFMTMAMMKMFNK